MVSTIFKMELAHLNHFFPQTLETSDFSGKCVFLDTFKSSGWRFPFFPCFPCSLNLLHVLQSGIAWFHNFRTMLTRIYCQSPGCHRSPDFLLMILMTHQCVFFCKVATAVRIKGVVCLVPSHTFPQNTRPIWNDQSLGWVDFRFASPISFNS